MPLAPRYELSLRHLPDMSNDSFSFQIPGNTQDVDLLADDGLDFFNGVDLSRGTPQISPVRATKGPLSVNDITPGPMLDVRSMKDTQWDLSLSNGRLIDTTFKPGRATARLNRPEPSKLPSKDILNPRPAIPSLTHLSSAGHIPFTSRMTKFRVGRGPPTDVLPSTSVNDQELIGTESHRVKGFRKAMLEINLPSVATPSKHDKLSKNISQTFVQDGMTALRGPSNLTERRPSGLISRSLEQDNPAFPSLEQKPSLSEHLNGDESTTDMSFGLGGRAAVQSSQNLINSFGPPESNAPSTDSHVKSKTAIGGLTVPSKDRDDADGLLTLSQLSPRKRSFHVDVTPTPPASTSVSSVTSVGKRPASVASENSCRKKSRTQAPPTTSASSSSSIHLSVRDGRHSVGFIQKASKPSKSSRPAIGTDALSKKTSVSKPSRKASTVRAQRVSGSSGVTMGRLLSTSSSLSSTSSTRVLRESRPQEGAVKQSGHISSLTGGSQLPSAGKLPERPMFQIPPLRDARPNERPHLTGKDKPGKREAESSTLSQSELQSQNEKKYLLPIPDFKAMHAAQEAKLALLKENVHPTLPQPIRLETDRRVIERQKFDDMVKEKQREHERLMEEKRREREEQEERELRELRKKSIPKAHIVPEWYKEAPKKKDKHVGSLVR